jgi:hypothetical protein
MEQTTKIPLRRTDINALPKRLSFFMTLDSETIANCPFDFTLRCNDGTEIRLHKLLLWAHSAYFRNIQGFQGSEFELPEFMNIQSKALQQVIDAIYGDKKISEKFFDNLTEVLRVITMLQFSCLMEEEIFVSHMSFDNVLMLWEHSLRFNIVRLRAKCFDYVIKNHRTQREKFSPTFIQDLLRLDPSFADALEVPKKRKTK